MPSLVQSLTGSRIRHVKPVPRDHATGLVREVYRGLEREFALVPPMTILSPSSHILAGTWMALREIFIVDPDHRAAREIVASGVSLANTCPYCVNVHSAMLDASARHEVADAIREGDDGAQRDPLLAWARATRDPQAPTLRSPPFGEALAPQMLGTVVLFHFVNRLVSVFVEESPAPVSLRTPLARKLFGRAFAATLGKRLLRVQASPGASLRLAPRAGLPSELHWAVRAPAIAHALSSLSAAVESEAGQMAPPSVRSIVYESVQRWRGEDPPLGRAWLAREIAALENPAERACATLMLLTAFAPYSVSNADILTFREHFPTDRALVAAAAWASLSVTLRIMTWVAPHA